MRNKKKKLTPQQKLLKRKKMIERQEKKIINELKLEEQQILEQQKHQNYIDGIKNKMEEIGDIGNLYHITNIGNGNSILNTGLKGGNEKISQRKNNDGGKRNDTYGNIYFIDDKNPRTWNGVVVQMLNPTSSKERNRRIKKLMRESNYLFNINKEEYLKRLVGDII